MATQNINNIVNVVVQVSPSSAPRSNFNEFLIIGPSTHISTGTRLKLYTSLAAMQTDGFLNTDPEYEAALIFVNTLYLYFGTGAAFNLWIGTQGSGESALVAVEACRAANAEWYGCMVCGAAKADHEAIAAWAGTANPTTFYAFTTSDSDALDGTTGNVFQALQAAGYSRSIGQYSTSSPFAIAGAMGYAMGQNTLIGNGISNSAYTMKFKQEIGVTAEPLTSSQIGIIEGQNGNLYLNYGNFYNFLEQGVMSNGSFFDVMVELDVLASRIQLTLMDLYYQNPSIPITDGGMTLQIGKVNQQCDVAVTTGFIAPGVYLGPSVLNLANGQTLPKGYLVQCAPVATQLQADRAARKSMPLYVAVKLAQAVHSALITVNVSV